MFQPNGFSLLHCFFLSNQMNFFYLCNPILISIFKIMNIKYLTLSLFFGLYNTISAQTSNPDIYKKHVSYLASEELEGRGLGTKGKDLATDYIQKQFVEAGLKPFGGDFLHKFEFREGLAKIDATNIVGIVEGTDPKLKNEYIVLGAHYDHLGYIKKDNKTKKYFPGADDNASGVSAIIELAKHFGKEENKPKRSLIFIAFDAEESGLIGSEYFVKNLDPKMLESIKAMFSFDMVGMLNANNGINLKGITNVYNGKELAEKHAGNIKLYQINSNIEERTDTYPFGAVGIPAVHVFTGLKSPYHRPEDKAHLLDYDGMVVLNQFMGKIITELSNAETDIKGKIKQDDIQRFDTGILLNIGNGQHLYKKEFYDAKFRTSYGLGLQVNYKLSVSGMWQLQFAPMYESARSASPNGTYSRHSFVLPLNIELGTPNKSTFDPRVFAFVGAFYRHTFAVKDGQNYLSAGDYKEKEIGYNIGFGLDFARYRASYTYRGGLDPILKNTPSVYQSLSFLTIGYRF